MASSSSDGGTLRFNAPQYFTGSNGTNGLTLNNATVVLNGGANTVLVQPTGSTPTLISAMLNGGTLDLGGNDQAFERIQSASPLPGAGANITSATAANLFTVPASGVTTTYAGAIGGAVSFYKQGAGTTTGSLILTAASTYTGSTTVNGGTLSLRDSGALTGTSAINIDYGQLILDNTGLSDSTSRISSTVPINLNGGTFTVAARGAIDSENIGTVSLLQGFNQILLSQYNNSIQNGSFALNVGNLVQSSPAATLNFPTSGVTLGQTSGNPHVFLTQVNGTAFSASSLVNGIIGGWAISNGADFASYTNVGGVTPLGSSISGVAAYSGNTLAAGGATDNISINATIQNVTARTVNSVAIRNPGAATTVGLASAADVLNIGTGGLLFNDASTKGITVQGGQLTAGGASTNPATLYIYANGTQTSTINSQIVDNGTAPVSLVRSGGGVITLTPQVVDFVASVPANSSTITVTNAAGLVPGMVVSGTNMTAGTTIKSIAGTTITLSSNTGGTAGTNVQVVFQPPTSTGTSTTTAGNNSVTIAANALGANFTPATGMAIGGPNIPGGTTITSVSGSAASGFTLGLSQNALASASNAVVTVGALSNTYTGGTYNNGGNSVFGTLNLTGLPGSIVVPGDLTIGNAGVTMVTNQGQIAPTSNVTWVSGGTLTLVGTNTLNSLTFNGNGTSGGTGTAAVGTLLNVSAANAIASINNDLGHTPTISGTALALTSATPAITTSGLSSDDLVIAAPITAAGGQVQKMGAGSVVLSGASTFSTGVNVVQGSLIFGANSAGTTVTSGPVGTGTLTLSGGTSGSTLLSDGTARTIGNTVNVTGAGFTFGGTAAGNSLTLSGPVTLAAGANINVASPLVTGTISGALTAADLTKTGPGILTLSNAGNTFTGGVTIANGVLKTGVAQALPSATPLTIAAAGEFDLNGFASTFPQIASAGVITNSGAAATLILGGTSATDNTTNVNNTVASFSNGANALNVTVAGLGTLTLTGPSSHTGTTTVPAAAS